MSDLYFFLKTVHILAVMVWLGGQVAIGVRVSGFAPTQDACAKRDLEVARRVMNPAMFLAISAGIAMTATLGPSFWGQASWLHVKLVAVLALLATHGWLISALRRASRQREFNSRLSRLAPITLALAAAAVFFAVAKPTWTS